MPYAPRTQAYRTYESFASFFNADYMDYLCEKNIDCC